MFKFIKDDTTEDCHNKADSGIRHNTTLNKFKSHLITELHYNIAHEIPFQEATIRSTEKELKIKYINITQLLRSNYVEGDEIVKQISNSASDLISGVYEGGFKIWECTFDLINHLENNPKYVFSPATKVLDLGCGSGLLGLYALSQGAMVDFHDYNPEVLRFLTIPNVIKNHNDENVVKCRYFSGDWSSFDHHIQESPSNVQTEYQYDYIFSSETVYNIDYLPNLCSLVKCCLKPTGIMILAAKTCYFGVGGGTTAFQSAIAKNGKLVASVLETIRSGVQREIIAVKWKS